MHESIFGLRLQRCTPTQVHGKAQNFRDGIFPYTRSKKNSPLSSNQALEVVYVVIRTTDDSPDPCDSAIDLGQRDIVIIQALSRCACTASNMRPRGHGQRARLEGLYRRTSESERSPLVLYGHQQWLQTPEAHPRLSLQRRSRFPDTDFSTDTQNICVMKKGVLVSEGENKKRPEPKIVSWAMPSAIHGAIN